MLAGVYGICSLAASWIIAPLMYWNMTDGHNFRTQENCFRKTGEFSSRRSDRDDLN